MSEEVISAARGFVDCYNASDWDGLRDLMTSDSVYDEVATGRRCEGPDAIIEVNKAWKAALPDSQGTITDAFACGDRAALQVTWNGTQSGPLALPTGGELPPTNRQVNVPACQIMRVADGKLVETRHFFDVLAMLDQLGTISEEALTTTD